MPIQFFRAIADLTPGDPAGTPIRFTASTEQVARDGFIVDMAGWRLDNYRSNPVFLWAHDYASPPIGRAEVSTMDGTLKADVTFDQADDFARQIERKYRDGFLSAVSVGFNAMNFAAPVQKGDAPHITEAELLDISAVPVPSDPRALKGRTRTALENYLNELETEDAPASVEPSWTDAAIEMMRLFNPQAETTDKERRRQYNRLERIYRQAGKVAPEFMRLEELDGLEADEISGLFLEGETELLPAWMKPQPIERKGAVLSSRNKNDLEEACRLIQSVVDRAQPMMDEDENKKDDRSAYADKFLAVLNKLDQLKKEN
jgi:HK97 family phage prohead protease